MTTINLPSRPHPSTTTTMPTSTTEPSPIILAFDLYGTLLSTSSISNTLSKFLPSRSSASELASQWRTQQLEYTWRLNSMGMYQPFSTITKTSLLSVLQAQGITLSPGEINQVMDSYNSLEVFPDAAEALGALAKEPGVESWIFTNGTDEMAIAATRSSAQLEALFSRENVVTVSEVRRFKPAPEVYWHLLAKVGKPREKAGEVWLVSGNPFDVVGAKTLGLKSVWVDREGKGWNDGLLEAEPDLIVTGLGSIVSKIRDLRLGS